MNNKKQVTHSPSQVTPPSKSRIIPSTSSVIFVGSCVYGAVFGLSFIVTSVAIISLLTGVSSFLLNYVKFGAYLPENQAQHNKGKSSLKRQISRLQLKDNLKNDKQIDLALSQLKSSEKKSKEISQVLSTKFNQGEISFERFNNINIRTSELIENNLKHFADLSSNASQIEDEDLRSELLKKSDILLVDNQKAMYNLEKLLVSLSSLKNINETTEDVNTVLSELEMLVERSKKFKS